MKKGKIVSIGAVLLLLIISGIIYTLVSKKTDNSGGNNITSDTKKTKKVYKHTFPKRISGNDFFKGEFISNDVASVFPRRDALVKDILVDIGDSVKSRTNFWLFYLTPELDENDNQKLILNLH
ncbi:MAG: hypothetical protein Q9M97_02725 [Candidatus Gracilibacteria bacterium]|nr:hypothetical protein [Candidatus Gracilibacteria bacterium]